MADADLIIENGTIVTEGGTFNAALIVANGQVVAYAEDASGWDAPERIDATGLLVMPGGIDVHTHFEEPDPDLLEGFTSGGPLSRGGWPDHRGRDAPGTTHHDDSGAVRRQGAAGDGKCRRGHGALGRGDRPAAAERR